MLTCLHDWSESLVSGEKVPAKWLISHPYVSHNISIKTVNKHFCIIFLMLNFNSVVSKYFQFNSNYIQVFEKDRILLEIVYNDINQF